MKSKLLILVSIAVFFLTSCKDSDGPYANYEVATAITMSRAEFKNSGKVDPPKSIDESGKIYAYGNYIFVNDKSRGIHIIDNTVPQSPQKIAFLNIPGNVDVSIKDDVLFADSISDLLVFDISDINNITLTNRLENVLPGYVFWPAGVDLYEGDYDYQNEILLGWSVKTQILLTEEVEQRTGQGGVFFDLAVANAAEGGTGQGGSLARFKIVGDYLYAVDSHSINVFGIQDLNNPTDLEDVYAGFDIETIFNRGNHLFLGSMRGMYIYDITSPATPTRVSEFEHGTACDPVVVDGDYAYVTLRGGNECGALESGLFIVDISDITKPTLKKTYPMDNPYGLGVKDEKLFVCDGTSGLKVYNKTNVDDIALLNHFKKINAFDVIPLESHLVLIGDGILLQYEYLENEIRLMSNFNLN